MRILIIICAILLMTSGVVLANDVPYDIMEDIKKKAAQEYPDSYSMQKFKINMEVKAYIFIQNYSNDKLPYDVLEDILDKAAQEYPDSYSMQKFKINMEVKAYLDIHN